MTEKAIAKRAYEAAGGDLSEFKDWWEDNIVEFDCNDCGKHVVRLRNDSIDIDGIAPVRCGSCTLEKMRHQ